MSLRVNTLFAAAALTASGCAVSASESSLKFALNVSRHVLLHEFAHALIREFGLPVLGNEEDMADTFATVLITQVMRDDAVAILKDRARSWLYEAAQVKPEDYDLEGEHELDTRRAFRTICLLYGADPAEFTSLNGSACRKTTRTIVRTLPQMRSRAGGGCLRHTRSPKANCPPISLCSTAKRATQARSDNQLYLKK